MEQEKEKQTIGHDQAIEAELKKLTDARGDLEKFAQTQGMTAEQLKGELRKMMKQLMKLGPAGLGGLFGGQSLGGMGGMLGRRR